MQRSLRWRLTVTFTTVSTLTMLIYALAVFMSTEAQEEDLIDEVVSATLKQELQRPRAAVSFDRLQYLSPRLLLYRSRDKRSPPVLPADYAKRPPGHYEWINGDVEYHVGIRQSGKERTYLLYDASEHEIRLDRLMWSLVAGLIGISLLSLAIGYWLAGQILHPLAQLIERLHRDDAELIVPDLDREVEQLARGLDHYRQRSRELLAREREFTANASHELRTPLTRIRTNAELLTEEPTLDRNSRARAARIVGSVDELEANLRSLLFLARELEPSECRRLPLAALVSQSVEALSADFDVANVALHEDIAADVEIEADAALFRLMLDNLLRNALKHTHNGFIRASYRDGALHIADSGVGIPPEHLQRIFERYYRANDEPNGQGLGLAIVKHICDAYGWHCTIQSLSEPDHPLRGTCVSVAFDTVKPPTSAPPL